MFDKISVYFIKKYFKQARILNYLFNRHFLTENINYLKLR